MAKTGADRVREGQLDPGQYDSSANHAALGGNATATTKITGGYFVAATADATAGAGGVLPATGSGLSGTNGGGIAGTATATATATGVSSVAPNSDAVGGVHAKATSDPGAGAGVITAMSAQADGVVTGAFKAGATATAFAQTSFNAASSLSTTYQSVATVVGSPTTASVNTIRSGNSNINAAYAGKSAAALTYMASGEIGGAFDTKGAAGSTETMNQAIKLTIDTTKLTPAQQGDLLLGLYNGTTPTNLLSLDFAVSVDGTAVSAAAFSGNTSNAKGEFSNHSIDLGSLASLDHNGDGLLDVSITMSETFSAAGSFYGQFLLGDPPAAASSHGGELAKALFDGFFDHGSGASTAATHAPTTAPTMTASAHDPSGAGAAHPAAHA